MSSIAHQQSGPGFRSAAQVLQMGFGFEAKSSLGEQVSDAAAPTSPALAPALEAVAKKNEPEAPLVGGAVKRGRGRPRKVVSETLVLEMPSEVQQLPLDGIGIDKHYVIGHYSIKHPKIFPPPNSKNLDRPRKIILEQPRDGVNGKVLVLLGNSVTQCFTTQTLNLIAVLNEMWHEQGAQENGLVSGSYSELVRRLKLSKGNEFRGRTMVKSELERLRRLPMKYSELDSKNSLRNNVEVSYLCYYSYIEDLTQSHKNHFLANIDPFFVGGVKRGLIASLPIKSLLEVKQSESKAILLRIDSLMVYNARVVISKAVFADLLCIEEDSYMHTRAVYFERLMKKVCDDLNGRVLTNGCLLKTTLEDGLDRGPRIMFERGECVVSLESGKVMGMVNTDDALINRLKIDMLAAVGEPNPGSVDSLYELYARTYPAELIERAISVFKSDRPRSDVLISAGAFFSSVLSRVVKENGYKWIR